MVYEGGIYTPVAARAARRCQSRLLIRQRKSSILIAFMQRSFHEGESVQFDVEMVYNYGTRETLGTILVIQIF